jgi:ubiquinone biosynthesis protein COQ9
VSPPSWVRVSHGNAGGPAYSKGGQGCPALPAERGGRACPALPEDKRGNEPQRTTGRGTAGGGPAHRGETHDDGPGHRTSAPTPRAPHSCAPCCPMCPFEGWSDRAFVQAAGEAEVTLGRGRRGAPAGASTSRSSGTGQGGPPDAPGAPEADLSAMKMRERVAFALKARMTAVPQREALRRSAALFALPVNAALGAHPPVGDGGRGLDGAGRRLAGRQLVLEARDARGGAGLGSALPPGRRLARPPPHQRLHRRRIDGVMAFEKWKAGARDNPVLRPLARPLGWIMGQIRAPLPALTSPAAGARRTWRPRPGPKRGDWRGHARRGDQPPRGGPEGPPPRQRPFPSPVRANSASARLCAA